jgi:glycosyltransferase involved in cell wall biosynthesis
MDIKGQKIAVLCDYRLLPERVGGMDHFFWRFDAECKTLGITVIWFFPNSATHGDYGKLTIIPSEKKSVESSFLSYFKAKNNRFTHIITHFLELCTPFFKEIKQKTEAKIIAVDHNPRPLEGYPVKKRLKKRLKGAVYSRYIDVFVGVSKYTLRELMKDFGSHIESKCHVIYNGIVIENIKERISSNLPPRFVVVSHLRESKGIQDLIEAVHLLSESIKNDLKINVYGEGPFEATLKQLTRIKEVSENFVFKGSSSSISTVFCQYDYLLHPTHMECFSLTLLESLAANVPVITTPVGGNLEVVEDGVNGFIVPVQNPEQLAELIEQIWTGKKNIQKITRSKIELHFGVDSMVSNHLELLGI